MYFVSAPTTPAPVLQAVSFRLTLSADYIPQYADISSVESGLLIDRSTAAVRYPLPDTCIKKRFRITTNEISLRHICIYVNDEISLRYLCK